MRDTRAPTFELRVVAEGEQGYRLALWQRAAGSCAPTRLSEEQEGTSAVSPLRGAERGTGGEVGSRPLVTLAGSALQVALDQVLDALKREGHRATALRPTRGEPLVLGDEAGVRLACHPHDPAVRHDTGLRGIHRVLGSVDGLKKFISIAPSKYHGLNFCQGTVGEMLKDPGKEIFDVIRYFGERKKIFMVHFRNIKGGYLNFEEVYPDNGDMDMYRSMRLYQDVGYEGMFLPDHVPQSEVDPDGERQHSFCLGYIRALIQVVNSDVSGRRPALAL